MKFLFLEETPGLKEAFFKVQPEMWYDILIRVSLLEEISAKRQEDRIFEDFRPVTSIT